MIPMVLSKRVARFNRKATNRVAKYIVGWAPSFGMVIHKGRKSGKEYRTPINCFRRGDRFVIGLTYGPDADWVRNILAEGGCTLITRRREYRLTEPEVVHDEQRRTMPWLARPILALVGVDDYLALKATSGPSEAP